MGLNALFLTILAATLGPASHAQTAERSGTVYRGVMTGGIWLELAQNASGQAELAILDGLPGGTPQTRFIGLARDVSGDSCTLVSDDASVRVNSCEPRGAAVTVALGDAKGDVVFQEVSWPGSFAWGGAAASVADARARCLMPGMYRIEGLKGTSLATSLASLKSAVSALPAETSDLAASIDNLRTDRLAAYSVLALTTSEAAASAQLEAAIRGRDANGKVVSLADATRMRQEFEKRVSNAPGRAKAREDVTTADRQLAAIYDPIEGMRQTALRGRIRNQLLPSVQDTLIQLLANRQPAAVDDLLALELAASDVEACAQAVSMPGAVSVRQVIQAAIGYRAGEVADYISAAVAGAEDSTAARQVLAQFENNPGLKSALVSVGKGSVFSDGKARIAKMAADEDAARLAGIRAAARQAAADGIPPTTAVGRFNSPSVARSIVYISMVDNRGRGFRGSGFVVAPGVVVTNVHVVENSRSLIVTPDGKDPSDPNNRFAASIIKQFPVHDVAVLRVPNLPGRVLAISSIEPDRGQDIWAVGYPGDADAGLQLREVVASFTRGVVMRIVPDYTGTVRLAATPQKTRVMQYDALTSGGSSGGAILDSCHRIVAVHFSGIRGTNIKQGISATILPELLRQAGVSPKIAGGRCN